MEEPGRLQSMGSLRVGHDWMTSLSLFTFVHWRRKWQPTPVFLPGESQGRGSLVGCHLWGHTVGHDWSNLAAAGVVNFLGISVKPWSYLKLLHTLEYLQQNLNSINQKKSTHTHHQDSPIGEKRISKKGRVYQKSSVLRPFVSETCLL